MDVPTWDRFLRPILTFTSVWNTGEAGDMNTRIRSPVYCAGNRLAWFSFSLLLWIFPVKECFNFGESQLNSFEELLFLVRNNFVKNLFKLLLKISLKNLGTNFFQDVRTMQLEDRMDSFVLAETFKYLYLLFAEESDLVIITMTISF